MGYTIPQASRLNVITATPIGQLITEGEFTGATAGVLDVAGIWNPGAVALATDTGIRYVNNGTTAVPSFGQVSATVQAAIGTVATTGNTDAYVIAPQAGTLLGIDYSDATTLAANDTNYVTFSATNLGQAGSGTAAMLAATDVNTTKATGGTGITANAKRALTLSATKANLVVAVGDRIRIRVAVTGTLGGALSSATALLRFGPTS